MDPIPGSKDKPDNRVPKTATEEGMLRLMHAIEVASHEYNALPFFAVIRGLRLQVAIKTMTLIVQMLHELEHKYNNTRGEWN